MNSNNQPTEINPERKRTLNRQVVNQIIKKTKHNYKVSESDKQIVVAMFASGLTPTETSDLAKQDHNIIVAPHVIAQYGKAVKWQPLIRKIREAHMNDLSAVAGSYKRVRLDRHEKVYEKALKKGDLRNAIACTVEQRKEMEGEGSINMTLNQFNTMTDDELEHKKKLVMEPHPRERL